MRFHGDGDRAKAVYKGLDPLTAEDVAETVVWVASRPDRVSLAEIVLLPTAQASAMHIHRT